MCLLGAFSRTQNVASRDHPGSMATYLIKAFAWLDGWLDGWICNDESRLSAVIIDPFCASSPSSSVAAPFQFPLNHMIKYVHKHNKVIISKRAARGYGGGQVQVQVPYSPSTVIVRWLRIVFSSVSQQIAYPHYAVSNDVHSMMHSVI